MAKKFYAIGCEKVKNYCNTNRSKIKDTLSSFPQELQKEFGQSYYKLEILKFFKKHSIHKNTHKANKLFEYFCSQEFILQNIANFALIEFVPKEQKQDEHFLLSFYYRFCFVFFEKIYDETLAHALFEANFLHFASMQNTPTNINIDYQLICKNILKPKVPKESFGESEDGVFFKLVVDSKELVNLQGSSIKTLRKKAYKELFRKLDTKES